MHQYRSKIKPKASKYLESDIARSFKADPWCPLGYENKAPLKAENLISLILYCDYDLLSGKFTETFRPNNPLELVSQIKQRHREYWWWGKILHETVQMFGYHLWKEKPDQMLKGPFFTGMSVVMKMPRFNILLESPVSTSVHIEVACKFSNDDGMIIEFDNSIGSGSTIRGFDVSWISKFADEDERYFNHICHV